MHELAVCQALLGQVGDIARSHGASEVVRIAVAIGPLSGVEAPLLERAFTIARAGTVAADAVIELSEVSIRVRCRACHAESDATINRLVCRACGEWRTDLMSGDELLLVQVEMEENHV